MRRRKHRQRRRQGWSISPPHGRAEGRREALAKKGENPTKAIAIETVAEAVPAEERSPGRPRKGPEKTPETVSDVSGDSAAEAREVGRLRAITNAPAPIRDLYRTDLISKGTAVALGTTKRDTSPTKAAAIAEATTTQQWTPGPLVFFTSKG
jgi:hypothetical protein